MRIEKKGRLFQLTSILKLTVDLDTAWQFLSNPANLKVITPEYMGFNVMSGSDQLMYAGQVISYKVSPILGIKMNWVTEITHVREKEFFVDEQRMGPYAFWHHQHLLKPIENGTEMKDVVHYQLPFALLTNPMHSILVRPRLQEIFEFRKEALTKRFGSLD